MIKNNILLKLSYADSFTILNGIFGLLSIFSILQGSKYAAFVFVLLAVLADGMDGIMARKYGGYLGRYMDEFSDIVSFLISPCIFAYAIYKIKLDIIFFFSSAMFLIFGMLHLINYHISKKEYFIGITTPASAIIVMSASFLALPVWTIYIFFILLAILMVFPLPYPRIEKHFAIIACVIIFLAMTGYVEFIALLLIATILYAVFGPVYIMSNRMSF